MNRRSMDTLFFRRVITAKAEKTRGKGRKKTAPLGLI